MRGCVCRRFSFPLRVYGASFPVFVSPGPRLPRLTVLLEHLGAGLAAEGGGSGAGRAGESLPAIWAPRFPSSRGPGSPPAGPASPPLLGC